VYETKRTLTFILGSVYISNHYHNYEEQLSLHIRDIEQNKIFSEARPKLKCRPRSVSILLNYVDDDDDRLSQASVNYDHIVTCCLQY